MNLEKLNPTQVTEALAKGGHELTVTDVEFKGYTTRGVARYIVYFQGQDDTETIVAFVENVPGVGIVADFS